MKMCGCWGVGEGGCVTCVCIKAGACADACWPLWLESCMLMSVASTLSTHVAVYVACRCTSVLHP
jgi:hypothetical protein